MLELTLIHKKIKLLNLTKNDKNSPICKIPLQKKK